MKPKKEDKKFRNDYSKPDNYEVMIKKKKQNIYIDPEEVIMLLLFNYIYNNLYLIILIIA